jgi:NAD(P)-dependent dehydrogenase (short-subunit alcohol dehydrogenase family)
MAIAVRSEPETMDPLAGSVAVVTGGASGIGRATSEALVGAGCHVVVADIDRDMVRMTVDALDALVDGPGTLGLVVDVRREDQVTEMAAATLERFGRIDVLVACAGILRAPGTDPTPMADLTLAEWDAVLDVNLRGTFLSDRGVLPAMLAQGSGQIVNISSTSGRQGRALDSAYCASKAGVIGLTESLAEEVRAHGIRVQCLLPDAVATPIWAQNGPIPPPGAILPPERIAEVILFLLRLPADTTTRNTVVAPLGRGHRRATRRPAPRDVDV